VETALISQKAVPNSGKISQEPPNAFKMALKIFESAQKCEKVLEVFLAITTLKMLQF